MKVENVISYSYFESERRKVFKKERLNYYVSNGYNIVRNGEKEGFWIVSKPTRVYAIVQLEDETRRKVECKNTIISYFKLKKISKKKVDEFFKDVEDGFIALEFDEIWGDLVAFEITLFNF